MCLVGQPKIQNFLDVVTLENCPHFIIIKGGKRTGKTLITKLLAEKLGINMVEFQPSSEQVRNIISTIYSIKEPCLYWCEDLEKMHINAKNSLLKVTEETPKFAYIVIHTANTPLSTLNSRAQVFELEPYSFSDYEEYCKLKNIEMPESAEALMLGCNSLAEFEYQVQTGKYADTLELANKVLDYIGEVSTVNAFKIVSKLALKKDAEGLDPVFFLIILLNLVVLRKGEVKFGSIIVRESIDALSMLRQDIFSKTAIMNRWVLKIMKGIDEVC